MPRTGNISAGELLRLQEDLARHQRLGGPLPDVKTPMERASKTLGLRGLQEETAVRQGGRVGNPPDTMPSLPGESRTGLPGRGTPRRRMPADIPLQSIRGRGQVQPMWDENFDDYYWHASPEKNRPGIIERGLDPELRKGYSEGVHFSSRPDYPVIGDTPYNYYRVKRSDVLNPQYRSGGDVYTRSPIPPEKIEGYRGPGNWTRLGSLYDILGWIFPSQDPLQMALSQVIGGMPNNPYDPRYQGGVLA